MSEFTDLNCQITLIEIDRNRYKSLWEATDARMRAAEEVIKQMTTSGCYLSDGRKEWQASIAAHEKLRKEMNHE